MKRAVALALTLVLLLTTFAGCIKKTDGSPEPEDTSEYEALYAPVLKKYKQAFDEGWSREKFAENHLAPGLANLEKTAEPSFAFVDLDGDKTPELFIGRADEPATAYDMYSIKDDTISQLTDAAQDTTLTLTDDCRMIETDDSYAHLEVTVIYEVKDGEVTMVEALIHDPDMMIDGMHPFFRATAPLPADEKEIYGELVEAISEEDYSRAATQYKKAETQMKTFEEYAEDAPAGLTADEAVAIYMRGYNVWLDKMAELVAPWSSYNITFLDLDFDGVLEMVCNWRPSGTGVPDANAVFKIDGDNETVDSVTMTSDSPRDAGSTFEGSFFSSGALIDTEFDASPMLLRDQKTGQLYYCFSATEGPGSFYQTTIKKICFDATNAACENIFEVVYQQESETYTVNDGKEQSMDAAAYKQYKQDFLARHDDLKLHWAWAETSTLSESGSLNWLWTEHGDLSAIDEETLRQVLLTAYRAFDYDGYEPIGGRNVQWYTPPLSDEEAVDIYWNDQSVWHHDSDNIDYYFYDIDGDGVLEVEQVKNPYDKNPTSTYYRIDQTANCVVKVSAEEPAPSFQKLIYMLRSKTDGSVRIFGENLIDLGSDRYERSYGTMWLTESGLTSELLFAKRYHAYDKSDDDFQVDNYEYYYYENGEKKSTNEADYNARMTAFFEQYDLYTVVTGNYYYNSYEYGDPKVYFTDLYQGVKSEKATSLALTQKSEMPEADRGLILTANNSDFDRLDMFEYVRGGNASWAGDYSNKDMINYDYRDSDAVEKAYRHLSFGYLGPCFPGCVFGYDAEADYSSYDTLPASEALIDIPGKTSGSDELQWDSYDYQKMNAGVFDAALRTVYNVEPNRSFYINGSEPGRSYRVKAAFYDGGAYYVNYIVTGDMTPTRSVITDITQNSDGSYTIRYHDSSGNVDDWESWNDYHETNVVELEITAALKELDGYRVWSFYQIKEVF